MQNSQAKKINALKVPIEKNRDQKKQTGALARL